MAFISWYVPTVLLCSERLVNTTKPQNDTERGNTFDMNSFLGEKMLSQTQICSPREVIIKWMRVRVMLGKPNMT